MIRGHRWFVMVALGLAVGCGQGGPTGTQGKGDAPPDPALLAKGKEYLLDAEPAGARGVLETRKSAGDGEEIVMVGRIAGSAKPFVDGRAAFAVADLSIKPCPADEGCPTPWDCCCTPSEDLLPAMAMVKFVGEDGKTLPADAKQLLGVKELSVVVVKGKASRDEKGNLTVQASGLHVRPDSQ